MTATLVAALPTLLQAGFFLVLLPPALLALSAWVAEPWLVVGVVFLLFPLSRLVFGALSPIGSNTSGGGRRWLDALPYAYMGALACAIAFVWWRLLASPAHLLDLIGWTLSLWATLVFGTCVAHALLHSASARERLAGHLLSGAVGYPLLGYEHLRHHRLAGNTDAAEWPRITEPAWRFAVRRLRRVLGETVGPEGMLWPKSRGAPQVRGLRLALAMFAAVGAGFAFIAGMVGALMWAATVVLVALTNQLVTYIQHWGLGDDQLPEARERECAWEDDCRFQAWMTLNLSVHQAHHHDAGLPYHRLSLHPESPRLPVGYVLLFIVAMIPPLWRRLMAPALAYWLQHPGDPPSAGHHLTCVAHYRSV
jgi:fatty acid desaturase